MKEILKLVLYLKFFIPDITCEKISEVAYIYTAKMEVSEDEVQIPKPPGLYSVEEESDEGEGVEEEESDSDMSYRDSPIPDDTNCESLSKTLCFQVVF